MLFKSFIHPLSKPNKAIRNVLAGVKEEICYWKKGCLRRDHRSKRETLDYRSKRGTLEEASQTNRVDAGEEKQILRALNLSTSSQMSGKSRQICFYDNEPGGRGTAVTLYDYADYAEKLLGLRAHIIFPKRPNSENTASKKFKDQFNVTLFVAGRYGLNGVGGPEV